MGYVRGSRATGRHDGTSGWTRRREPHRIRLVPARRAGRGIPGAAATLRDPRRAPRPGPTRPGGAPPPIPPQAPAGPTRRDRNTTPLARIGDGEHRQGTGTAIGPGDRRGAPPLQRSMVARPGAGIPDVDGSIRRLPRGGGTVGTAQLAGPLFDDPRRRGGPPHRRAVRPTSLRDLRRQARPPAAGVSPHQRGASPATRSRAGRVERQGGRTPTRLPGRQRHRAGPGARPWAGQPAPHQRPQPNPRALPETGPVLDARGRPPATRSGHPQPNDRRLPRRTRKETGMDIGEQERVIIVEPLHTPGRPDPDPGPLPPEPQPEPEPTD